MTGRLRLCVLLAAALVLPALAGSLSTPADAGTTLARVRGAIIAPHHAAAPKVKVLWFTIDWTYLGTRNANGGAYSLALPPGTYRLQFVDQRPSYDVGKFQPADVTVTLASGRTTIRNVHLHPGAAIGGTVSAGGKAAPKAVVVAANAARQSFTTTADKHGDFALGGLPPGNYSVFTYDHRKAYVAKSIYLKHLKGGSFTRVDPALGKRGGGLLVDLYAGTSAYPGHPYVTAVSRKSGQFWTQRASHGSVTFQGLYPGRYDLVVPGVGVWLGDTVRVSGRVHRGRVSFGSARLTRRGAWVTGTVVDANDTTYGLGGAQVSLRDSSGHVLATATSAADGTFLLQGQLLTGSGLSVVAGPGPYSPYLGQGTHYCKYAAGTVAGLATTTGQASDAGTVALPHLPDSQQDGPQCYTPGG